MANDRDELINAMPGPDEPILYVSPKNEIVNISELWAYLSVDQSDNTEGIVALTTPTGHMPMIAADLSKVMALEPHIRRLVEGSGIPIRLVKFTAREDIREIKPKK